MNKLRKVVKGKLPNPKTINEKLLMPFCRRVFTLVTKDERAAVEAGGDFPELPVQDWWAQWPECHPVRIPAEAAAEAPAKKKRGHQTFVARAAEDFGKTIRGTQDFKKELVAMRQHAPYRFRTRRSVVKSLIWTIWKILPKDQKAIHLEHVKDKKKLVDLIPPKAKVPMTTRWRQTRRNKQLAKLGQAFLKISRDKSQGISRFASRGKIREVKAFCSRVALEGMPTPKRAKKELGNMFMQTTPEKLQMPDKKQPHVYSKTRRMQDSLQELLEKHSRETARWSRREGRPLA